MTGTRAGAKKMHRKLIERDPEYYRKIGRKGGARTHKDGSKPKGFAAAPERARTAGATGGARSKPGHRFVGYDAQGNMIHKKIEG